MTETDHYAVIQRASRVLKEHLPLFRQERDICREAYQQIKAANAATEREVEGHQSFEEDDEPRTRSRPVEKHVPQTGACPRGTVLQKILGPLIENAPRGMTSAELTANLGSERRNALSNAKKNGHIEHRGDKLWYPTDKGRRTYAAMSALAA